MEITVNDDTLNRRYTVNKTVYSGEWSDVFFVCRDWQSMWSPSWAVRCPEGAEMGDPCENGNFEFSFDNEHVSFASGGEVWDGIRVRIYSDTSKTIREEVDCG